MSDSVSEASGLTTLTAFRSAAALLRGLAVRTPLLPAPYLGDDVWLKPELLQPGGSFKIRGAVNFIRRLEPDARARGVVAPSSGNHAQAVALAGQRLGVRVTVVLPTTVTDAKRSGAMRLGARIELAGTTSGERIARARAIADAEGSVMVPSFDHPDIIAGQGTIGLEIVEDLPCLATVVVPVGGGGLSAGVAAAIKQCQPSARVVGVEPQAAPKLSRALRAGCPIRVDVAPSIIDALLAEEVGELPFLHHQRYVDDVVGVEDDAVRRAMRLLADRAKMVVEPGGAIAAAAILDRAVAHTGPTVVILSGGNIEWPALRAALS